MIVLNPGRVEFAGEVLAQVTAVTVDRGGKTVIEAWSDEGPFARFVDVPERRTVVKVVQEVLDDELDTPAIGDEGALSFVTASTGSDVGRRSVAVSSAVVTGVAYQVGVRGVVRTLTLAGVSADGVTDPVSVSAAGGVG